MSFERPTLPALVTRIEADFVSRLSLVGAVLRRAIVAVLSRVVAGAAHMLHGHLEYLSKQLFADQSDEAYLIRQAGMFGITKNEATFATATVGVTGTNGSIIPTDTVLLRSDGAEYTTDADVTIASGVGTLAVRASLAGSDGTLTAGVSLSFESPVPGVDSTGTVAASTADGNDEETTEELRARFLEYLRDPPQGGAEADYIAWAKEVTGVTRAWVYPQANGAGTVVIRFVRDNDAGSIIPSGGEVTAVQTYIDALRPVTATVSVVAPVADTLDFDITLTPNTADTRAAVEAELADLLAREAEPGGTLLLSQIQVAIGTAAGVTDFTLNDPTTDVTSATGHIPVFGTVVFS